MDLFQDKYLAWFILREIPFLGNSLVKRLIHEFKTPVALLTASEKTLQSIEGIPTKVIKAIQNHGQCRAGAMEELTKVQDRNLKIVTLTDANYPTLLREIIDPPPILTYDGKLDSLSPCISIVGSRKATTYGLNTAEHLASRLTKHGFTIVSGMARGIDSAAHIGALSSGGKTIAVLGSGLNKIYPRENKNLYLKIRDNGAVLSEFKLDAPPLPGHFPVRNRIIAGLSTGTVVVEAAKRSGSLITARLSNEYNREVFAVPGSIGSSKSRGTHALLKQGAKLVETHMDIIDELHQFIHHGPRSPLPIKAPIKTKGKPTGRGKKSSLMDKGQALVYKHLDPYPKHIDMIINSTGMESSNVTATLLDMELSGLIVRHPGNFFSITEE